jgi:hypothetical protein
MQSASPLYKLCCGTLVDSTSFQLITGGYSNNNLLFGWINPLFKITGIQHEQLSSFELANEYTLNKHRRDGLEVTQYLCTSWLKNQENKMVSFCWFNDIRKWDEVSKTDLSRTLVVRYPKETFVPKWLQSFTVIHSILCWDVWTVWHRPVSPTFRRDMLPQSATFPAHRSYWARTAPSPPASGPE